MSADFYSRGGLAGSQDRRASLQARDRTAAEYSNEHALPLATTADHARTLTVAYETYAMAMTCWLAVQLTCN